MHNIPNFVGDVLHSFALRFCRVQKQLLPTSNKCSWIFILTRLNHLCAVLHCIKLQVLKIKQEFYCGLLKIFLSFLLEVPFQIKWRLCEQKLLLGHILFGEQTSPCSDYSQVSTQELIFYGKNLDSESDYVQKLIIEQLLCLLFDRQWTKIDKLAAICSYFVIKHLCKQINNPPLSVINYSSNL